ncbi:MAG: hypothetical protein AAF667_12405 [Pseudomonadota bacterium]
MPGEARGLSVGASPELDTAATEAETAVEDVAPAFDVTALRLAVYAPVALPRAAYTVTVEELNALGLESVAVDRTPHTISKDNIRYYHASDREAATLIAEAIGASARDFTAGSRKPPVGTIEIWLSGRGAPRVTATKTETGLERSLRRLREGLANFAKGPPQQTQN